MSSSLSGARISASCTPTPPRQAPPPKLYQAKKQAEKTTKAVTTTTTIRAPRWSVKSPLKPELLDKRPPFQLSNRLPAFILIHLREVRRLDPSVTRVKSSVFRPLDELSQW